MIPIPEIEWDKQIILDMIYDCYTVCWSDFDWKRKYTEKLLEELVEEGRILRNEDDPIDDYYEF